MTIYRGVGGVNRQIKQQYRGVGGVNRQIKQQYRGVSGVNRLVYQAGHFFRMVEDKLGTGGYTQISEDSTGVYRYSGSPDGGFHFICDDLKVTTPLTWTVTLGSRNTSSANWFQVFANSTSLSGGYRGPGAVITVTVPVGTTYIEMTGINTSYANYLDISSVTLDGERMYFS